MSITINCPHFLIWNSAAHDCARPPIRIAHHRGAAKARSLSVTSLAEIMGERGDEAEAPAGLLDLDMDCHPPRHKVGRSERWRAHRGSGILPQHPLGRPPDNLASNKDKRTQCEPSVEPNGYCTRSQKEHGKNHCQVVRPGESAMRSATALRIEKASSSHPDKGDCPQNGSSIWADEQTENDQPHWESPRHGEGLRATCPILGGFRALRLFTRATRRLSTAQTRSLYGWTRDVSIGTEYAAVARLGLEYGLASFAVIEILAGVRRHCLGFLMPAHRTGYRRRETGHWALNSVAGYPAFVDAAAIASVVACASS